MALSPSGKPVLHARTTQQPTKNTLSFYVLVTLRANYLEKGTLHLQHPENVAIPFEWKLARAIETYYVVYSCVFRNALVVPSDRGSQHAAVGSEQINGSLALMEMMVATEHPQNMLAGIA